MDRSDIKRLIDAPSERLSVELKAWLELGTPEHKAKLVRALLALWNYNGGFILIGFDDKTNNPSPNPPANPIAVYHSDTLQGLVGTYASEPFPIEVDYPERDGVTYPVIQILPGVRTPVAVKKDIQNTGGKPIVRRGDVMFRTLHANNTVSSAPADPRDWPQIMEICFANREADLAGFVRRHLLSSELPGVLAKLGVLSQQPKPPSLKEVCQAFADKCRLRAEEKELTRKLPTLPETFGSFEVAAVLDPPAEGYMADSQFLNRLMMAKPEYDNGLWLDTRSFYDKSDRPAPDLDGWETLVDFPGDWNLREFTRLERAGRFYLCRALSEDTTAARREARAGVVLGIEPTIAHVAEALVTAVAFAKALGGEEDRRIGVLFRYGGLKDRRLFTFNGVSALLMSGEQKSAVDAYEDFVAVPVSTQPANLGPFGAKIIRPLFALFNGYSMSDDEIERRTAAYLSRKSR